jgi:hypothetical protein
MKIASVTIVLAAVLAAGALTASAATTQRRPSSMHDGMWAAGGDLGVANNTGDSDFNADPHLAGYVERYTSDHISWRGMISMDTTEDERFSGRNDVDITAFNGNVLYTWEGGYVHPFVTGGLGLYDYDPQVGDGDVEVGANAGGGANFFMTRNAAIKLEGLFHGTTANAEPDTYVTGTAGVRFQW